jgi:hypothetical protein
VGGKAGKTHKRLFLPPPKASLISVNVILRYSLADIKQKLAGLSGGDRELLAKNRESEVMPVII